MSTLSNVNTRVGGAFPTSVRPTPDAFPEARNSQTGVSVRYVPMEGKKWYVFRASYGREVLAANYLINDRTFAYVARHYVKRSFDGRQKRVLKSLIPNLLFAYTTPYKAEEYIKHTPTLNFLSFYYNHFSLDCNQKNPPLTIPENEMENFIRATSSRSEHMMFVSPEQCHFKGGDVVRVTNGTFKGVEGRVARVSGQQRVIVQLSNVGLISTAYIPSAFLQSTTASF